MGKSKVTLAQLQLLEKGVVSGVPGRSTEHTGEKVLVAKELVPFK